MLPTKVHPNALRVKIPALLQTTPAWIGHSKKRPLVLPQGRRAARTNDPKTWRSFDDAAKFYELTHHDDRAGIGFVFQQDQGIVFVDFDHCVGEDGAVAGWAEPFLTPFRGRTFIERSLSGTGLHVLVLGTIPHAFPKLVPPGAPAGAHIEVYNNLRFAAITGDVFGDAPVTLAPMQDEIDALIGALGGAEKSAGAPAPSHDDLSASELEAQIAEARSALAAIDPDISHDDWVRIGMALHHGIGPQGLALWDEWSSRGSKYRAGECGERWSSFRRAGVTLGTLFHTAREAGWKSPQEDPTKQFEVLDDPDPSEASASEITFPDGTFQDWVSMGLQLWKPNPKQQVLVPCFSEANLHRFFTHHEDWGKRLRYNIRTQLPEVDADVVDIHASYRALAQSHAFLGWTKRAYSVKTVQAVIQAVAERNAFDPVAEWLSVLEWDGTHRVEQLTKTLGIEDTPLTRRCLTRWIIGAVARAFRPGCKMQNMLLLLGPQGRHKSGLLERLAIKPEWFHESHVELKNKEGYITLDRKWIVEFAELDALRKTDVEKVKAFISESTSNYRAPYAKAAEDHARHFVLAGTANEDRVMRDPTGARRFWPIRCPSKINVRALTPDFVKQLWAEARHYFENGVRWWDEGEEVDEVNERNGEFYANSVSDIMIAKIAEEEFAPHGAMRMEMFVARLHEQKIIQAGTPENTIGSVLRRLKWETQSVRVEGQVLRFWFPPTVEAEKRKDAAVIVFNEWRRKAGLIPEFEEVKDLG